MGKLFCLSVFVRKMKATKATLDEEAFQSPKDTRDPCGLVDTTDLMKSSLVIDSPDSFLSWSASALSKDLRMEKRHSMPSEMQVKSSPGPQPDNIIGHNLSTELAKQEGTQAHKDILPWSLVGPNVCTKEEASVRSNEEALTAGNNHQKLHITRSCPDIQGECAYVCENYSEGLEIGSNLSPHEEFIRQAGEETSEYIAPGIWSTSLSQAYAKDGDQHSKDLMTAGYELEGVTTGTGFCYSPNTGISSCNRSDKPPLDDELLSGHVSDPGVYDRDDQQSIFTSSALLNSGMVTSSEPVEQSLMRKSESDCHICELVPSEGNTENLSAGTAEHGSCPPDITFSSADNVVLEPKSSNNLVDFHEHNSWWKMSMVKNVDLEGAEEAFNFLASGRGVGEKSPKSLTGYASDIGDIGHSSEHVVNVDALSTTERARKSACTEIQDEHGQEDGLSILVEGGKPSYGTFLWPSKEWTAFPTADPGLGRVEEWILNIQEPDAPAEEEIPSDHKEPFCEISTEEGVDLSNATQKTVGVMHMDVEMANAAIRSLNPLSTVAHIAGIGLREVPSLGKFNSLKTLNLSANKIVRVPTGCLPRSLHTLDVSRNRIVVIDGFRELSRLRVLNLSYNRISRIGHGLANCPLIKELYLAGNKIAEVEGLHRLLKLSILDLSFNKLTTSKTLGQLAANYNSLLALNLLGNPVHVNVGEEQLRKLVLSITPHVTYLNKQPIKSIPAREAAVDSVARAALGTFQRNNKSSGTRASRKLPEARSIHQQNKSHSRHSKEAEGRHSFIFSEIDPSKAARLPTHHHHHHQQQHRHHPHRHHNDGCQTERNITKEHGSSSKAPMSAHEQFFQNFAMSQGMHRSRSDSALQDQE